MIKLANFEWVLPAGLAVPDQHVSMWSDWGSDQPGWSKVGSIDGHAPGSEIKNPMKNPDESSSQPKAVERC